MSRNEGLRLHPAPPWLSRERVCAPVGCGVNCWSGSWDCLTAWEWYETLTPRFGATKSPTPTWCVWSDFEVDDSMAHCFFVTVYSRKLTSKCALLYFRIGFFKYGRSSCSSLMPWSQESLQSCENMMPGHHGFPLEHLDLGKFRDPVNRKISQFSIQYLFTDGSLAAIRFAPKKTRGTAFTESLNTRSRVYP